MNSRRCRNHPGWSVPRISSGRWCAPSIEFSVCSEGRRGTIRLGLRPATTTVVFCAQDGLAATRSNHRIGGRYGARIVAATNHRSELRGGRANRVPRARARCCESSRTRVRWHRDSDERASARETGSSGCTHPLVRNGSPTFTSRLHGATAAPYTTITLASVGASRHALAGLTAVRDRGLTIAVATVVTRSNFRSLAVVPELLAARGVDAWMLTVPRIAGRAATAFDRVVPRLAMAMPFALQADRARMRALDSLPLLLARRHASLVPLRGMRCPITPQGVCDGVRVLPRAGQVCSARPMRTYLTRFGDEELSSRRVHAVSATAADPLPAVTRLFVGVGELPSVPSLKRRLSRASLDSSRRHGSGPDSLAARRTDSRNGQANGLETRPSFASDGGNCSLHTPSHTASYRQLLHSARFFRSASSRSDRRICYQLCRRPRHAAPAETRVRARHVDAYGARRLEMHIALDVTTIEVRQFRRGAQRDVHPERHHAVLERCLLGVKGLCSPRNLGVRRKGDLIEMSVRAASVRLHHVEHHLVHAVVSQKAIDLRDVRQVSLSDHRARVQLDAVPLQSFAMLSMPRPRVWSKLPGVRVSPS